MTNYEKIKNMSVEEILGIICNENRCEYCILKGGCLIVNGFVCSQNIKMWLESEAIK